MSEAQEVEKTSLQVVRSCPVCNKQFTASGAKFCPEDKALLAPIRQDPLVGTVIAHHYKVEEVIGEGGWGRVYRASHTNLPNLQVAVKTLHSFLASDADKVRRFQQEAESVSRLSHPNIVHIVDFGVLENGQPYLVMDFVKGLTLTKLIKTDGVFSADETVGIALQCCAALAQAHERGIVHRDIKPSNILLERDSSGRPLVRLVDFGLAKLTIENEEFRSLTGSGEVIGTPAYMSPEHCSGHPVDARSDIYSLGCVLYEMLAGKPPIDSTNYLECIARHVNEPAMPFSKSKPPIEVPPGLENIILRCLEKSPDDRFQSASDMLDALRAGDSPKKFSSRKFLKSLVSSKTEKVLLASLAACFLSASIYFSLPKSAPHAKPTVESLLASADRDENTQSYAEEERDLQNAYLFAKEGFGSQSPQMERVSYALGSFYLRQQKLNRSEKLLEKCLSLKQLLAPSDTTALAAAARQLGDIYRRDRQPKVAAEKYAQALNFSRVAVGDQHPSTADLLSELASVQIELGDLSNALSSLEKAQSILSKSANPQDAKLLEIDRQLSLLYDHQGKSVEAEKLISKALSSVDQNSLVGRKVLSTAAAIYAKQAKYNEAINFSTKAIAAAKSISSSPETLSAEYHQLASILVRAKQGREAEITFKRALEIYPGNTAAARDYGMFLKASGRSAQAGQVESIDKDKLLMND